MAAVPIRQCLLTGERQPKGTLLRFVLGKGGELEVDERAVKPGRGYWLTPTLEAYQEAVKKRQFQKRSRGKARVPEALEAQVKEALERRKAA